MNHPLLLLLLTVAGIYAAKLWWDDRRADEAGRPNPGAFPGSTPASAKAIAIGIVGAGLLLVGETVGEVALGIDREQSRLTWLFAIYSVCAAPVIEELIFRGWFVVEQRGPVALWTGIIVASLLFALIHPFLWEWDDNGFRLTLTRKGGFSTCFAFTFSVWFYAVRFGPWNPSRSLLPCFLAHAAKNAGVVGIKATTGFMTGLW